MELAMQDRKENLFAKNPKLRDSYEAFKKRKEEGKLTLWERCKLGEILPNKIYAPIEEKEGIKCELCGDVGYRQFIQNGQEYVEECECFNKIQFDRNMKKSGANPNMTFANWDSSQDYQVYMAERAYDYANRGHLIGQWFFAGGQVGCGKTHVCTAILHELIKTNVGCRYMAWHDESVELKALVQQQEEYNYRIMELCKVPILYIDDLWKTQQGTKPSQADIKLAFQIINFRYQDKKYRTIVSCEYTLKRLLEIDEAVASRIVERSKGFQVEIEKDQNKNYRLKMG